MSFPVAAPDPKMRAAEALDEGFWTFSVPTEQVTFTAKFKSLLGYLEDELEESLPSWLDLTEPDDQDRLRHALLEQSNAFSIELLMRRRDGAYAKYIVRGWPDDLDPTRMVGTLARVDSASDSSKQGASGLLAEAIEAGVEALLVLRAIRNGRGTVADFEIADLNSKGANLIGISRQKALGRLLGDVAPGARENGLCERFAEVMRGGQPVEEESHAAPGGFHQIWLRRRIVPLSEGVAIFETDVSDTRRPAEFAERASRMFERITTITPDLHAILDVETRRFVFSNRNIFEMLGYEADRSVMVHLAGMERIVHSEDVSKFRGHFAILSRQTTDEVVGGDFRFRAVDGSYRWLSFRDGVFDRQADGRPKTVLCTAQDVTGQLQHRTELESSMDELRRAREELEKRQRELEGLNLTLEDLAMTDGLTGVKNRRAFQERLAEEVERAQRYNLRLALLLADVDHFKQYNDKYGHPGGDQALKGFAKVLTEVSRSSDTVARYGGEEFAIILPNTGADEAGCLAERIRASLKGTEFGIKGVTASYGCSEVTPGREGKERLIAEADRALYQSKDEGRDRVTVIKK